MPHQREDALEPRGGRYQAFRRRRWLGLALGACLTLLALALVPGGASHHPRPAVRLASAGGGAGGRAGGGARGGAGGGAGSPAARRGGAGGRRQAHRQRGVLPAAPTPAQVAAVRRMAGYGLPLFCGARARRMVALTFDDGPGPYTRLAVRKLTAWRMRATFFVVGKEIRAYPGLVALERPVAALGDHTMTHPFLPALARAAMVQEIAGARRLIERVADEPVVLFRPPYEGRDAAIDREARSLGMLEVLWDVDSADSLGADYAGIERNVLAGLRPGAIVLMHENRGQTIRALPVIFAALRRDRLRAVTVPQLVADDPPSAAQLREGQRGCSAVVTRAGRD